MPLYEYTCEECGKRFEKLAHSGDEVDCPGCGSSDTARNLGSFSVATGDAADGGCPTGTCSL